MPGLNPGCLPQVFRSRAAQRGRALCRGLPWRWVLEQVQARGLVPEQEPGLAQVRELEPVQERALVQGLVPERVQALELVREPVQAQEQALVQELVQERAQELAPVQALEHRTPNPDLPTAAAFTRRHGIWATAPGRLISRPMTRATRHSRSTKSSIPISLMQTETTRSSNGRREIGIRLCVIGRCLMIRSSGNGSASSIRRGRRSWWGVSSADTRIFGCSIVKG